MKTILLSIFSIVVFSVTRAQAPMVEWDNTIGSAGYDQFGAIQQTADGGYILGGTSDHGISGDKTEAGIAQWDLWVMKLDAVGNIVWQNTIGGNYTDILGSIQQTTDGGYIIGAYSASELTGDKTEDSQGLTDFWVIKLDSNGNIVWQNTIGGADGGEHIPLIRQTADGGYILGGSSDSRISGDKTEASLWEDYWILKLDSNGNIVWQNTIGGNSLDYFRTIEPTADGGCIVGGESASGISGDKTEANHAFYTYDYWVLKLDGAGNIVWQRSLGGEGQDYLRSVTQAADGGYLVGGYSDSGISGDKSEANQGNWDYWILKLDAAGNILWENTIGGSGDDQLNSIQATADGGCVVGGTSNSDISGDKTAISQSEDYWILKLDALGNILWQKTISARWIERFGAIASTADGGYIMGGISHSGIAGDKSESHKGSGDIWIVKLKPDTSVPSPACAAGERKVHTLTLVNAQSDTDIGTLHDGDVIDLSATGPVNVRANVCDDGVVESVKFQLNGIDYKKENIPFYSIAGDNNNNYSAWNITPGTYTIRAIPYSNDNAKGTVGTDLSVTISVVQSGASKTGAQANDEVTVPSALQAFPNPNEGVFNVAFSVDEISNAKVEIFDMFGKTVFREELLSFSGAYQRQLDLSVYPHGVYLLRVDDGEGTRTRKVVISER